MDFGDGIIETLFEGTEFANVSFPHLSVFVQYFVMKRKEIVWD